MDELTLSHHAESRDIFRGGRATGAARWVIGKKPGTLYHVRRSGISNPDDLLPDSDGRRSGVGALSKTMRSGKSRRIFFSAFEKTGRSWPMNDVQFLAPTVPSKIVCVGLNYKDHITEFGRTEIPEEPASFL